ncbi:MAG: asparaginase [Sphingobium sp.]|nr:asparaginase [Sphingobium sp.]
MADKDMEILVLTTGGTFDKVYFDALSDYKIGEPRAPHILKTARVNCPYRVQELLRKDSLDLTDEDRAVIVQAVAESSARHIVITHGSDTMTKTAQALADANVLEGRTIIFVGAMQPARFAETDAPFNLGMAFAAAQIAAPGIYIAMSGTIFPADKVVKNREKGVFVAS